MISIVQANKSIQATLLSFPRNTQLAAAVIADDEVAYYGGILRQIKKEKQVEPIENRDSVFEIGSITKLFTSSVLAQMHIENQLSIDDEIHNYLKFELHQNRSVTFRQLASHTAGLPRLPPDLLRELLFKKNTNPYAGYTEDRLLNYLKNQLKQKRKTRYRYSNLGVGILGYVLTQVAQLSFENLLQKRIFTPLDMGSSSTVRDKLKSRLVTGLDTKGRPADNWDLGALTAAGAMLSNVSDMVKYAKANFDSENVVYQLQQQETFRINKTFSVALGWHIYKPEPKKVSIWHAHEGGTGGYSSFIALNIKKRSGVIILSNISGLHLLKGRKLSNLAFVLAGLKKT